jgi:ferredoxin
MPLKNVWIENGCTSCGWCESICPEVFEMPDEAIVKKNADLGANEDDIIQSAESCPVSVICFEES